MCNLPSPLNLRKYTAVISLPSGYGKTTAVPATLARCHKALVVVVVPSATQAEAAAAYMRQTRFARSEGGVPAVAFSAQTAYEHLDKSSPAIMLGDASVVYAVAGPESCLHKHLLTQIAWGVFSVNQCQQIAREAVRDYEKTEQDPPAASFVLGVCSGTC